MPNNKEVLYFENASLKYRNFTGRESKYDSPRSIGVLLGDQEIIDRLIADGWNVKRSKDAKEEYYLPVKISFNDEYSYLNPKIVVITGKKMKTFSEDQIDKLQGMTMDNIDLSISPYHYDVNGHTGISAYLKEMYIAQHLSPISEKYADFDEEDDDNPFC